MANTKAAPQEASEHVGLYPCPMCATFVEPKTAICPSCGEVLKHSPRFAVVRTGPDSDWKERALPIVAVIWVLIQAGALFFPNGNAYMGTVLAGVSALTAAGIMFRVDWMSGIGKFVCGAIAVRGGFLIFSSLSDSPRDTWSAIAGATIIIVSTLLGYLIHYNEE